MAKTDPDTILLETSADRKRENDAQANGAFTPGDIIERDSIQTGGAKDLFEVTAHGTDNALTALLVALEYAKTGRGIDSDYADGEHVEYWKAETGDQLYMNLEGGQNLATSGNADVSVGDKLGSAGTGALRGGVSDSAALVEALETVTNSGSSTTARVRVEVI